MRIGLEQDVPTPALFVSRRRWIVMKKLNSLNPIGVFGVAVVAFVGWVVYDINRPQKPAPVTPSSIDLMPESTHEPVVLRGLERIRPGMSRPEVEEQLRTLGGVGSGEVGPVDLTAGFPTYRVRYRVSPGQAVAAVVRAPVTRTSATITATYDARTVGHPLVNVTVVPDGNGGAAAAASASSA
jgi:hypothetical protein